MKRQQPGWHDAELDWLVNASEGEHGRRAVPLEPSLGGNPDTMDDMRCEAAARARRIQSALATLTPYQRALLLVAHEHMSPRRCMAAQAAYQEAVSRVLDLATACEAFRRAWRVLGPSRGAQRAVSFGDVR